ncbi:MAG: CehA/McbA family metallohydrolase [Anaerolineaceae bacterium]|nr:CehA/McbA family metallohydrolase [Anaerolineaceae bacterium]
MSQETILNLHNHTTYSDGHGTYTDIAQAAAIANIDVVIVTDHNIRPRGLEKYYCIEDKNILILTGEEIHDRTHSPQKNHLLVFGVEEELAHLGGKTQWLIDRIRQINGFAFLAHPNEDALSFFKEPNISWVDWDITGFHGLEIWNGMSEFKTVCKDSMLTALFYAFFPHLLAQGANKLTMQKWDELLRKGLHVYAVGGTDSHATPYRKGPFKRIIYPYQFHFSTVNNHILTEQKLSGNFQVDRQVIFNAIRHGHYFVGYDLPHPTKGFRFTGKGQFGEYQMGDTALEEKNITLQIRLPYPAICNLIHNGKTIQTWNQQEICTHQAVEPGYYRIECYISFMGKKRGWIYSNPIFLGKGA